MLAITIQDNHCITTNALAVDATLAATTLTVDHNLLQTPTAATAQGYTSSQSPYVYFPTSGSSTIGAGVDLSANCSGSLAGLCSDTSYANVRNAIARGSAWDIGAYQYVSGTIPTITTTSPLTSGTVGMAYSVQFAATGDTPITWTATGVPDGLTLTTGGLLSGTPTTAAVSTIQVTATNATGTQSGAPTAFSLTVGSGVDQSTQGTFRGAFSLTLR
jgi:hypothetical protein